MLNGLRQVFAQDARGFWIALAYPRLREFPQDQRAAALRRARETPFDLIEQLGTIAAVGLAAWLLQHVGMDSDNAFARYIAQFALALPLLGCVIGPLLLRRTRRGLEVELAKRHGGATCPGNTHTTRFLSRGTDRDT